MLSLGKNLYRGSIPATMKTAIELETLDLSDNELTCKIAEELMKLQNLSEYKMRY